MKNNTEKLNIKQILTWIMVLSISAIFILAMVSWNTGSSLGNKTVIIGKVNNTPIKWSENSDFVLKYKQQLQTYKDYGMTINRQLDAAIRNNVFSQMAVEILTHKLAADNNITVQDGEIIEYVKRRYFFNEGEFDSRAFDEFRRRGSRKVQTKIENDSRKAIMMDYINFDLFSSIPVSQSEVFERYLIENYKKKGIIIYYNAEDDIDKYSIQDTELNDYYNRNLDKYQLIDISHIVVDNEAIAQKISTELKADPALFEEYVKKYSIDSDTKSKAGRIGYISQMSSYEELAREALKIAQQGKVSEPIADADGYHVLLINSGIQTPSINDVRTQLEINFINDSSQMIIEKLKSEKQQIFTQMYSSGQPDIKKIISVAAQQGFTIYKTDYFHYYSSVITDESEETLNTFSERSFITAAIKTATYTLSSVQDLRNGLAVIYISSQTQVNPQEVTRDSINSSELIQSIKKERLERIAYNFKNNLLQNANIKSHMNKYFGQ